MSARTPGPWRIDRRRIRGQFVTETHIISVDKSHIAEVRPCATEANAKLIASAPDLLEALKDLWGFVQDLQKSNPGYLGKCCLQDYAQLNRVFINTPTAIAKAEGTTE
jgi:hypothetical protein